MPSPDFERLVAEHAQTLYGFLAYRLDDPAGAEAALADTLARAVRASPRPGRRGAENAPTWLYALALTSARERAAGRPGSGDGERTLAEGEADPRGRPGIADSLRRALDALDVDEREVISLRYGADLPPTEIANVTRTRLPKVHAHLYSGLRKMQDVLDGARVQPGSGP